MSDPSSERMRDRSGGDFARPVVFLGPSMPLEDALEILAAEYRPPIKRGDLASIPSGALVGIIDGVFQQSASVSPREVHRAVERGVQIFGASSMGALRALEVRGMVGVGRIYQMYRDGLIISDDEVALTLDPDSQRPLTLPLVNVRFAVERLVSSGTLDRTIGESILAAAIRLHFTERTYPAIMVEAGLARRADVQDLVTMLARHDLKREDAHTLLEHMARVVAAGWQPPSAAAVAAMADSATPDYGPDDDFATIRSADTLPADAPVFLWETGDRVEFGDLVTFLQLTGKFERHARNALARYALDGNELDEVALDDDAAQALFSYMTDSWGWKTGEEAHVTTRDLGLGLADLGERCGEEMTARAVVKSIALAGSDEFLRALRAELFLDDLALKREAMRLGSLHYLAARGREAGPPGPDEVAQAQGRLAAMNRLDWPRLQGRAEYLEIAPDVLAGFVQELACARRVAHDLLEKLAARAAAPPFAFRAAPPLGLKSSPKAAGDPRYCLTMAEALAATRHLREVIGITRVGTIGELGAQGIHISQAARPTGVWSSTYGSGKGDTREGAIVGGVMEEVEKWAQERFKPDRAELTLSASYRSLGEEALDPRLFDLPYDTCYHPDLEIDWYPCWDLLQERQVLVPLALLVYFRCTHDIYFSQRGSRRLASTNGLASGFTLEEALVHGICEVVERHATRLRDIEVRNPGQASGEPGGRFLDPATYPPALARLVTTVEGTGICKVLLEDITCEGGIPVIAATVFENSTGHWVPSFGWGAHPNPEVAARMGVFEGVQSWISGIAGGREDLTLRARSLGRHERPRPFRYAYTMELGDPDRTLIDTEQVGGLIAGDAFDEVTWLLDRLRRSGVDHVLAVDLGRPEIAPARVCRVMIPGLDTTNPFYISKRSRMALLHDLLPRRPKR